MRLNVPICETIFLDVRAYKFKKSIYENKSQPNDYRNFFRMDIPTV